MTLAVKATAKLESAVMWSRSSVGRDDLTEHLDA